MTHSRLFFLEISYIILNRLLLLNIVTLKHPSASVNPENHPFWSEGLTEKSDNLI